MLQELCAAHSMDVSVVSLVSSGCTEGPDTVRCPDCIGNSLSIWHALHQHHPLDEVCSGSAPTRSDWYGSVAADSPARM